MSLSLLFSWILLSAGIVTDSVKSQSPLTLAASHPTSLATTSIERFDHGAWVPTSSLHFGACTSGVQLRIVLEAPHSGRWWWTSDLRTPETLQMSLGSRNLGTFGTSRPFQERIAGSLPIAIPLDLHAGPETLTVIASDPQGDVRFDVNLIPDVLFAAHLQNDAARNAWILGILTTIILAAIFLWRITRERAFGWYVAYISTGVLWVTTKTGFAASLFWSDYPILNHTMPSFTSRLSLVFFLLFLRDLLSIPKHFRIAARILDIGIAWEAGCALFALSSLALPNAHAAILSHFTPEIFEGPTLLLGLVLVGLQAKRGNTLARQIIVSCLPLLLAALFGSVVDLLHLDYIANFDTPVAIAGALLENILTTWVLANAVRSQIVAHGELVRDFDKRLSDSYDRYRSRIADDLHDDLSQRILAARLALHSVRHAWKPESTDILEDQLQEMALAVRDLSHQIHSSRHEFSGFNGALKELALSMTNSRLNVALTTSLERELLPTAGLELYRMIQEALSNAVRHGKANRIEIISKEVAETLEISVHDNGKGMDAATVKHGLGLQSISTRASNLGGKLSLLSKTGEGTTIVVSVPLAHITV